MRVEGSGEKAGRLVLEIMGPACAKIVNKH